MCREAIKNSPRLDCRTPITYNHKAAAHRAVEGCKSLLTAVCRCFWYVIGTAKLRKRGEISNINNNQ